MSRLVIASGNPGKLREFAALLSPLGFDAVGQGALGIGEADEPHVTFVENALAKARHASAASSLPALADDSGLCVDALGGAPGVRSARYAEDVDLRGGRHEQDRRNNAKLVAALAGVVWPDAYFVSALVFLRHADDPEPIVAVGRWYGRVVATARGEHGFGYDAYFLVPSLGLTAAEIDPAVKNRIGHRAIAMQRLVAALRERSGEPSGERSGAPPDGAS